MINYKLPAMTIESVESILKYTKLDTFEIIVVDNHSGDDSYEILSSHFHNVPQVKIINSPTNLGFGGGNNLGVKHASGDYYFFLNNDTIFFEDSLSTLLSIYQQDDSIALLQPQLFLDRAKTKIQQTCAEVPTFWRLLQENLPFLQSLDAKGFKQFRYGNWDRNSDKQVGAVCGAAIFCSKQVFDRIGGFDERFFMYFEEYDRAQTLSNLSKRLRSLTHKNLYTTKTSIIHLHNQSPVISRAKKQMYLKSFVLYCCKHFLGIK